MHNLRTAVKLSNFMSIIEHINFPCGVIFRFDQSFYKRVFKWDERLFSDFDNLTKFRQVAERNKPGDIATLCQLYGMNDYSLISAIASSTTSFTSAMRSIEKQKSFRPTTQLNLFLDSRVRM